MREECLKTIIPKLFMRRKLKIGERDPKKERERERQNITKTRSSPSQMFVKIGALKNFAILIGSGN